MAVDSLWHDLVIWLLLKAYSCLRRLQRETSDDYAKLLYALCPEFPPSRRSSSPL